MNFTMDNLPVNTINNEDCIEFMKKLPNNSVDLIIADPPYFKIVKAEWDNQWKTEQEYINWCKEWISECYRILKNDGHIYIYGSHISICDTKVVLNNYKNLEFMNLICWYKGTGRMNYDGYLHRIEYVLFYRKGNKKVNMEDIRVPHTRKKSKFDYIDEERGKAVSDLWDDMGCVRHNSKEKLEHPTQKPIKICDRIIKASSNEGDIVYIPFAGSGSEIESCIRNNRNWIATEANKEYIDEVIKPRIDTTTIK